ncbi:MAG: hypothetical protein M5U10_12570 [Candidatus Methanoperedens sp.]|nr:hypothetical protein [Candidatus Methanoperedens nitroreducens]MDJ1422737.1 hypothetical protein [Candidatus Methanoperedens sp.]
MNTRNIYILMLLLLAASILGCVGKGPEEMAEPSTVITKEAPVPPSSITEGDEAWIESDLAQVDSMFNELNTDISLEIDTSAFT